MIKNIVFDLGGVLVPLNRIACLRAFDEVVGYKDFGSVLSCYRQIGFFEKFENGDISAKKFRQIIRVNSSPIKDGKPRIVSDREIDYSLNCFLGEVPQDKIETLLFFRDGYRLFLLSNTNPISMAKCKQLFKDKGYKLDSFFEKMFLSYKMKSSKPGEEIFKKMMLKARILPEETLYVDDAPANIEAGEKLGFKTLLYDTKTDLYEQISKSLEREQR